MKCPGSPGRGGGDRGCKDPDPREARHVHAAGRFGFAQVYRKRGVSAVPRTRSGAEGGTPVGQGIAPASLPQGLEDTDVF